jgi:hypothetical protein
MTERGSSSGGAPSPSEAEMEMNRYRRRVLGLIAVLSLSVGTMPLALGSEPDPVEPVMSAQESLSTTEVGVEEPTTSEHVDEEEPSHDDGHSDRLSCSDIDPDWQQLAVTGHPVSGHYTVSDAFRTVQFFVYDESSGGKMVNWHSDGPIDAVILRSGPDSATYEYEPPARSDTGLLPPLKDREGRNLAALLACYDPAGATVGIELSLGDSEDPVTQGDIFDYVVDVSTSDPLTDSRVEITLPTQISALAAPGCTVAGDTVTCSPPLTDQGSWTTAVSVSADAPGDAIARAVLTGQAGDEAIYASSVEVTRIVGSEGHDDGCGEHEDEDECGGGEAALIAACSVIDPEAITAVLPGPFASRRYLVEGDGGARIWATISESSGVQTADWESNLPIDAVLARAGRDIVEYRYGPLTFEATGIVGPPGGGSDAPRPMADLAFCYLPRHTVDVGLTAAPMPTLAIGDLYQFVVDIANRGYREAIDVSVLTTADEGVRLRYCPDQTPGDDHCSIGQLGAGDSIPVEFQLVGRSPGPGAIVIEVRARNEAADARADNVLELTYLVEAPESTQAPPSTTDTSTRGDGEEASTPAPSTTKTTQPGDSGRVSAPAELPFTGARDHSPWLILVAAALVASGALLVLVRVPISPRHRSGRPALGKHSHRR